MHFVSKPFESGVSCSITVSCWFKECRAVSAFGPTVDPQDHPRMPIERLDRRPPARPYHADGEIVDAKSGLSARADRTHKVTLSFRYRFGKVRPRIFLGTYPNFALADARIEAGKIKEAVRRGRDPQADRRSHTTQAETSFDELADLYLTRYARPSKASWRVDQQMLAFDAARAGVNVPPLRSRARTPSSCCSTLPPGRRSRPTGCGRYWRSCSVGRSTAA